MKRMTVSSSPTALGAPSGQSRSPGHWLWDCTVETTNRLDDLIGESPRVYGNDVTRFNLSGDAGHPNDVHIRVDGEIEHISAAVPSQPDLPFGRRRGLRQRQARRRNRVDDPLGRRNGSIVNHDRVVTRPIGRETLEGTDTVD